MYKVQFPMQYYSFLLDLAACCPSAHCLSIQRISQHPLHSPGAPINATFYSSILCIPTNRHQRTFSTWRPCQGPFLFFLQTQTSGKVTTYKKYLEHDVDPLAAFWVPNSEALSHPTPRPCHFLLILPGMLFPEPNSDLSFGLSLEGTFSRKIFLTYLPATGSGTASVLPWHPAPHGTCNFLIDPTSHQIVSSKTARLTSCCLTIFLPVSSTVMGI